MNQSAELPTSPKFNGTDLSDKRLVKTCSYIVGNKEVIAVRWYKGFSRSSSTVYCNIYVHGVDGTCGTNGTGKASGHGYEKYSTAFENACDSAGIKFSEPVHGRGEDSICEAIKSIGKSVKQPNGWFIFHS